MDSQINLQSGKTKYYFYKHSNSTVCNKTIKLNIFGEVKFFTGIGVSCCTKENIFNPSFGKALAWIRASQDIGRQVEVSLIKYTFDHFVESSKTDLQLDNKFHVIMKDLAEITYLLKEQNEKRPETINIYDADGNVLNTINLTTNTNNKPKKV